MFFILLIFYAIAAFFIFFDMHILFVNEEFLIFICMSLLFILLVSGTRKLLNFTFFLSIESIYFFFIYLIALSIKLLNKVYLLILVENFKLDNLILVELYNFFNESVNEFVRTEQILNSFLIKNMLLALNTNIFSTLLLSSTYNLTTNESFNLVKFFKVVFSNNLLKI